MRFDTQKEGTGIGLYLLEQYIRSHYNNDMLLELADKGIQVVNASNNDNGGATITMILPVITLMLPE